VVALDLETGAVKWARVLLPYDAWTVSCAFNLVNPENCPSPHGPDHDIGQGPMLFEVEGPDGSPRELLGVGQKNGMYRALDPATGEIVWETRVGPAGDVGGLMWGSATDSERVYAASVNSLEERWELVENGKGTGRFTERGFWSAVDARTGTILWQTTDPNRSRAEGPVTVANGVVFAGSMERGRRRPTMFALSAETGKILWRFASGGSVNSGPAVVDGVVYWGSGYPPIKAGAGNNKLFAFALPAE
jgi:polyvinyl alcohol dehydrogenase (cytochrome)